MSACMDGSETGNHGVAEQPVTRGDCRTRGEWSVVIGHSEGADLTT